MQIKSHFVTVNLCITTARYLGLIEETHVDCKDVFESGHTSSGIYQVNPDDQTPFKVAKWHV